MPDSAALPRWFIVVRRGKPVLFQHLREQYSGDGRVEVIVDRRRTDSTDMPAAVDTRRAERRLADRRLVHGDRRQAARREPLAPSQHAFWVTEGFSWGGAHRISLSNDSTPPGSTRMAVAVER